MGKFSIIEYEADDSGRVLLGILSDGPAELQQLAQEMNLSSNTKVIGFVPNEPDEDDDGEEGEEDE